MLKVNVFFIITFFFTYFVNLYDLLNYSFNLPIIKVMFYFFNLLSLFFFPIQNLIIIIHTYYEHLLNPFINILFFSFYIMIIINTFVL